MSGPSLTTLTIISYRGGKN